MTTKPESRADRWTAAFACGSALVLALAFAWPIGSGRVFSGDDLGRFHLPTRHFYAQCLARGDDWRWHPGMYCGFPLHGEGQAGMSHPLHRLLYGRLPLATALQAEIAICYPVAFAGMLFWLRRTGLRWDASSFGALVFAYSGFLLLRYVHVNAIVVLSHLPWGLLAIEVLARPRSGGESAVAGLSVALLTASQGLMGYPQYLAFSLLSEALYAAFRLGRSRRAWLILGAAIGLGVLSACVQIVPTIEALANSTKGRRDAEFLGINSLHPMNLLQIVAPYSFRQGYYDDSGVPSWPVHEHVAYLGAVVPACLAWLWIRRRDLGARRSLVRAAAWVGLAAMVFALGRHSPIFPAYAALPIAGVFRGSARMMVIAQLCAAILSAVAFEDVATIAMREQRLPRRCLVPLLIPTALALATWAALPLVIAARPAGLRVEQIACGPELAASTLWIVAPCLVFAASARGLRLGPLVLIALAAADAATYAIVPILRHERPVDPDDAASFGPVPPTGSRGRVSTTMNDSLIAGARLVGGYAALSPRRVLESGRAETSQVSGVEWIRSDPDGTWQRPPRSPLPRARLVARVEVSERIRDDMARIDPEEVALIDHAIEIDEGTPGEATILLDRPGRIQVSVLAPARRLLVVSEAFHPGWRAAIDGRTVPVERVYGDLLGCVVEADSRRVVLRFDPGADRLGRNLSACGWLGMAVALLFARGWFHRFAI